MKFISLVRVDLFYFLLTYIEKETLICKEFSSIQEAMNYISMGRS